MISFLILGLSLTFSYEQDFTVPVLVEGKRCVMKAVAVGKILLFYMLNSKTLARNTGLHKEKK